MVDSEDITLEKTKTQKSSLQINTLSYTFNQNTSITDKPSETLTKTSRGLIRTLNPSLKYTAPFVIKIVILSQHVIEKSIS